MSFAHPAVEAELSKSRRRGIFKYLKGKEISFCQSTGLRDVNGESVAMVELCYCAGERGASLVGCIASVD